MKVDKRIVEKLVRSARKRKSYLNELFVNYINDLRDAKTVEEVLEDKQEFLLNILDAVPLSGSDCYFCILNDGSCKDCEYGKVHKRCIVNERSDYNRIMDNFDRLKDSIYNYYYRDEYYKERNQK